MINKELIEKSFKDEKEIAELKEKVEELSLHIHFKDETIRSLNNKLRELTKVDEFEISNLEIIKIITSCISFYYPNLKQMMNRIVEEYD